jgi:hypothetical protein
VVGVGVEVRDAPYLPRQVVAVRPEPGQHAEEQGEVRLLHPGEEALPCRQVVGGEVVSREAPRPLVGDLAAPLALRVGVRLDEAEEDEVFRPEQGVEEGERLGRGRGLGAGLLPPLACRGFRR